MNKQLIFDKFQDDKVYYELSENVSNSSEYGGNTLNYIAQAKPWMTCYVQFLNYLRIIKEIKNKEEIILDVGCGQAELMTVMRNNFKSNFYIGIEINDINIKKAKKLFIRPNREILLKLDVSLGLPFPDNSIDHVTCNLLLEHLDKKRSFFVFSELVRVCKYENTITIMMPIRQNNAQKNNEPKHIYEWILSDIDELAKKHSLHILEKYYTSVKLKDLKNDGYGELINKLKNKIDGKLLRAVLSPLCTSGRDIFIKFKKTNQKVIL